MHTKFTKVAETEKAPVKSIRQGAKEPKHSTLLAHTTSNAGHMILTPKVIGLMDASP